MGRRKKPNYLKIVSGSAKKNPQRHKDDHLIPEPVESIGNPPSCLTDNQKAIWNECLKIIPDGVAKISDRLALEMLCRITESLRTNDDIVSAQYTVFNSLIARFGLSPSDRQNVKLPSTKNKSSFDDC